VSPRRARPEADVGVFGGSGFSELFDSAVEHTVHTPYGPTSGPVAVGRVGDRRVAFLERHGPGHVVPPHRVNFRANVWAMRELGVRRILGPCSVGSLQPGIAPGDFVVLDQLVDRTWGRPDTYFDGHLVHHVSFADPYCPELRAVASASGRRTGAASAASAGSGTHPPAVHDRGTCVVIQGPRFSTRAESRWFRDQGWHVVGMTQYPEAFLARELGICYCGIALVTDYDAGLDGVEGIEPVTMDVVFRVLQDNVHRVRELLFDAIAAIPDDPSCSCRAVLDDGPLG